MFSGTKGYRTKPPAGVMLNPLHPLSQGLVGYWLFNEGAGSRSNDISGHGNHGTLTGMSTNAQGSGWGGSKFGGGLHLDGSDDSVSLPNIYLDSSFTIYTWVKIRTHRNDDMIISRSETSPYHHNYYLNIKTDNGNKFQFGFYDTVGSAWREVRSNVYSIDAWYCFCGVWDDVSDTLSIYVNGVKEDSNVFANAVPSDAGITNIGCGGIGWSYCNCDIDFTHIYNRALSASEVKQLHEDPFCNLLRVPVRYVAAAPGGLSIPVAMNYYRRRRVA